MVKKNFKKLTAGRVWIFRIKNRRGYAAICMNNLTEGRSPDQAFERMIKAVKRSGYALTGKAPKAR